MEKNKQINKKSILKNKECDKNDEVFVSLKLDCDGQEIEIVRKRKEDTLERLEDFQIVKTEQQELDDAVVKQVEGLQMIGGGLYQNYFLDMGKAYRFMNLPRTSLREQIKDFMEDTSESGTLINKLKIAEEELQKQIGPMQDDYKNAVKKRDFQKEESNKLVILKELPQYPAEKAYSSEETLVESVEQAKKLQKNIRGWGFAHAENLCKQLENNQSALKDYGAVQDLLKLYEEQKESIDRCIQQEWYLVDKRAEPEQNLIQNKKIIGLLNKEFSLDEKNFEGLEVLQQRYAVDKKQYEELAKDIKVLNDSISAFEKGTKLMELFHKIINSRKEIVEEYIKKGYTACPLCGSTDQLSELDENALGKEADKFLKDQDQVANNTIKQRDHKKQKATDLWNQFKDFAAAELQKQQEALQLQKNTMDTLWAKTEVFFDKLKLLNVESTDHFVDHLKDKSDQYKNNILEEKNYNSKKEQLKNLLCFLENEENELFEKEEYRVLSLRLNQFYEKGIHYETFNQDVMIQKLTFLDAYLNSQKKADFDKQLKTLEEEIKEKERKLKEQTEKGVKIRTLSANIQQTAIQLENCEIDKIGPYIQSIFSKIIKHANIKEIHFTADRSAKSDKAGVSLEDEKKNNVMNMMSDGQMSVFMVAYFIGNLMQKSNKGLFASYFIDDVTSFLDDINMLSFLDILKYIMADSKDYIQQLFFCTCNKNVEELMKNRMEGFGIGYTKVEFLAVGQPKTSYVDVLC